MKNSQKMRKLISGALLLSRCRPSSFAYTQCVAVVIGTKTAPSSLCFSCVIVWAVIILPMKVSILFQNLHERKRNDKAKRWRPSPDKKVNFALIMSLDKVEQNPDFWGGGYGIVGGS